PTRPSVPTVPILPVGATVPAPPAAAGSSWRPAGRVACCPPAGSRIVAVGTPPRTPAGPTLPPSRPHPASARTATAPAPAPSVAAVEEALVRRIGTGRYQLWFAAQTRLRFANGDLVVGVPNLHVQEYLGKKFGPDVQAAAKEAVGRPVAVRFVIDPPLFQAARAEQAAVAAQPTAAIEPPPAPAVLADPPPPEPRYAEKPPAGLFDPTPAKPQSPR